MANSTQRQPTVSRRGDRLIQLSQILEIWPIPENTLRYKRHRGELPWLFKSAGRLMCWESDLYAFLEQEHERDALAAAS